MDRNHVLTDPKNLVRMELKNAGFTIAKYRKCAASAIYVVTDILNEDGWSLGWQGNEIGESVEKIINLIIDSVRK